MADETEDTAVATATPAGNEAGPTARLKTTYESDIRAKLQEEFGYASPMQHPKLEKITLSMGVGEAKTNSKALDEAVEQMAIIAGQRPVITKARKSIAQFKLREGMAIGCKVTLRGNRMWEFLDRLTSVALPRIRDFRGHQPRWLRRTGQLQPRPSRADHLPRDRLRQRRRRARPQRDDHHHRRARTRRDGRCSATSACRSARRATRPRSGQPAVGASRRSSAAAGVRGESWQRPAFG